MTFKKLFYTALLLLAAIFIIAFVCNRIITNSAKGKLYTDANSTPNNRVGLLLGTSKLTRGGKNNPFYDRRIAAAVELIKAHKIKYIIVSGDNSRKDYDEPTEMRTDLMKAGIDSSIIFRDYAGFRTFDSIKRLKEVFGQDTVTIISQQFHNERAIYIAERLHILAIGYNAADVSAASGFKTMVREKLARTKVFLDFLLGKEPKFLGEKVVIPE